MVLLLLSLFLLLLFVVVGVAVVAVGVAVVVGVVVEDAAGVSDFVSKIDLICQFRTKYINIFKKKATCKSAIAAFIPRIPRIPS